MLSISEYRHILRIAGKDIDGSKKIIIALSQIKGLGYNLSQVILQSLNINPNMVFYPLEWLFWLTELVLEFHPELQALLESKSIFRDTETRNLLLEYI